MEVGIKWGGGEWVVEWGRVGDGREVVVDIQLILTSQNQKKKQHHHQPTLPRHLTVKTCPIYQKHHAFSIIETHPPQQISAIAYQACRSQYFVGRRVFMECYKEQKLVESNC